MFKIFDEKEKDSTAFLKLVTSGGVICLAVVDKRGSVVAGGYLLNFNDDGTFTRRIGVKGDVGVNTTLGLFTERT